MPLADLRQARKQAHNRIRQRRFYLAHREEILLGKRRQRKSKRVKQEIAAAKSLIDGAVLVRGRGCWREGTSLVYFDGERIYIQHGSTC